MTSRTSDPAASLCANGPTLNIGQLAALAAVSTNAVRYYEREGLMQAARKPATVISIDGELVFSALPTPAELAAALRQRLTAGA